MSRAQGVVGGADHALMRRVNRAVVLDHIRAAGSASRAAIAEATGLAKPTVSLIVDELMRDDLVFELGHGESGAVGGRPPVLLGFNARSSYLAGIHVGVRRTTVVVADALGDPLAQRTVSTPRGAAAAALADIAGVVHDVVAEAGASAERVGAVGVCLPGLVTTDGVLLLAPNLGWREVSVTEVLAAHLGMPVFAYNAAHTSLVAERHEGSAVGCDDVVLVYAGTGVGAAAVVDGRLVRGSTGVAGEFGHVRVVPDGGGRCNCGKTGCLETVASAAAVAADTAARWGRRRRRAAAGGAVTAVEVAAAAAEGDRDAIAALAAAGRTLGSASAWLVNVLNPERLVLAGGLAGAGPAFVDAFTEALGADALAAAADDLGVATSALGQDAEVRGVLLLAREHASADVRIVTS